MAFLSLMLFISNAVTAKAEEKSESANQGEIISVIENGNAKAVVIQEDYGVFTYEYYENDVLIRSQTKDLFSNASLPQLNYSKSNYDLIESDSGWGIARLYDYKKIAFTCPIDFVDEGALEDDYLEIEEGKDDNYVKLFELALISYIGLEADLYEATEDMLITSVLAAITLAGAVFLGKPELAYQAAMDTISTLGILANIDSIVEDMTTKQDEMAFFYRDLFIYDIS